MRDLCCWNGQRISTKIHYIIKWQQNRSTTATNESRSIRSCLFYFFTSLFSICISLLSFPLSYSIGANGYIFVKPDWVSESKNYSASARKKPKQTYKVRDIDRWIDPMKKKNRIIFACHSILWYHLIWFTYLFLHFVGIRWSC